MADRETAENSAAANARPAGRVRAAFAWLKPPGWFPYLVLGLGVALSLETWRYSSGVIDTQITAEMKDRAAQARTAFDRHVLDYVYAAHKLQGAIEASDSVTRKDF